MERFRQPRGRGKEEERDGREGEKDNNKRLASAFSFLCRLSRLCSARSLVTAIRLSSNCSVFQQQSERRAEEKDSGEKRGQDSAIVAFLPLALSPSLSLSLFSTAAEGG